MRLLVVSSHFPPRPGGSSVIMHNLLKGLNQKDIVGVITQDYGGEPLNETYPIYYFFGLQRKLNHRGSFYVKELLFKKELRRLIKLIIANQVTHVLGVYPDFIFLRLAYHASLKTDVKLIPYLHDTIAEGLSHTKYRKSAKVLQEKLFRYCPDIFVMSEGMHRLYLQKYNKQTQVLTHSFPEDISDLQKVNYDRISEAVFWGGAIYGINKNAVFRIIEAAKNKGMRVNIAASISEARAKRLGLIQDHVNWDSYSREDYLKLLREQKILILALDWPEESAVHRDELSTIFPTKTIEYLAAGRPIIVHCPNNYFLAKYLQENNCAYVVSCRKTEEIEKTIDYIQDNTDERDLKIKNAMALVKKFSIEKVVQDFYSVVK
ncbi:MAG: glycosyltransferase [Owenweeksia sp.]|nr:glycosyltransferase [Owenweeksia sp.]